MALKLHEILKESINLVNSSEEILLFISRGQINNRGIIKPQYEKGRKIIAQIQDAVTSLNISENIGNSERKMTFYLPASENFVPQCLNREQENSGDILERADGTRWLIVEIIEDYSKSSNWIKVSAILQTNKGV